MELMEPRYEQGVDTQIVCEYKESGKSYDIIAGGSGFHQALTLLAFLYGYKPTTMLLDEPDAHMHVNLQREILDYFKRKSGELCIQFLVATHAEELVRGVDTSRVVSILGQQPQRMTSTTGILTAMADVSNAELSELAASPFILYVEGETDERILRAWASICNAGDILAKVCFHHMGGGTEKLMKDHADRHYEGVKQVIQEARRLMLFDYDTSEDAFHPGREDTALFEWRRKNIENYLLVPDAWKRAAARCLNLSEGDLFSQDTIRVIEEFYAGENLTLPRGQTWNNLTANIFHIVDGKRLLFEAAEALFARLKRLDPSIMVIRENIAGVMTQEEVHKDIFEFFDKLRKDITV